MFFQVPGYHRLPNTALCSESKYVNSNITTHRVCMCTRGCDCSVHFFPFYKKSLFFSDRERPKVSVHYCLDRNKWRGKDQEWSVHGPANEWTHLKFILTQVIIHATHIYIHVYVGYMAGKSYPFRKVEPKHLDDKMNIVCSTRILGQHIWLLCSSWNIIDFFKS